ncbi:hypothetical protein BG011_005042 [Mortierella polycephala]|uniref:Corrinoid adenosyltransferase MMAB n=1 Tax=Mortierella polycephala TaxID=41804 RepID=A0A9P6PYA2_9FUNG|nr:hypothetical protein BG011_005042 [Mortierella polycephala]
MFLSAFKSTLRHTHVRHFAVSTSALLAARPKIYTKTGDKGTSALFTGERRLKDDVVFDALGNVVKPERFSETCAIEIVFHRKTNVEFVVRGNLGTNDELTSAIGLAREFCLDQGENVQGIVGQLEQIQCLLQDVGSNIATPRDSATAPRLTLTEFDSDGQHVQDLEDWIDAMDQELPPLARFILPSGGKAAAALHVARSVSRRTERRVVPLAQEQRVDKSVAIYLNRLSDYLFTCGRYAAMKADRQEVTYRKPRPPRAKKTPAVSEE